MKAYFTVCTPIPGFIPRPLALKVLHDHQQVITLNPLVVKHMPIAPPRVAAPDEMNSSWYDITKRVQYLPGLGRFGKANITFPCCFHDLSWGLQTHVHAPLGVDLRIQYRVAGEQLHVEEPEVRELGLAEVGAPAEGLYLRADVEFRSSFAFASFIRSQLKTTLAEMVSRFVAKAECLDAGALRGMIDEDQLKRNSVIHVREVRATEPIILCDDITRRRSPASRVVECSVSNQQCEDQPSNPRDSAWESIQLSALDQRQSARIHEHPAYLPSSQKPCQQLQTEIRILPQAHDGATVPRSCSVSPEQSTWLSVPNIDLSPFGYQTFADMAWQPQPLFTSGARARA